jgi:hypothetical protein
VLAWRLPGAFTYHELHGAPSEGGFGYKQRGEGTKGCQDEAIPLLRSQVLGCRVFIDSRLVCQDVSHGFSVTHGGYHRFPSSGAVRASQVSHGLAIPGGEGGRAMLGCRQKVKGSDGRCSQHGERCVKARVDRLTVNRQILRLFGRK